MNNTLLEVLERHMASYILVSNGSVNGLLPTGTKSLPEPKFIYHQLDLGADFDWIQIKVQ